jgi:steroid 5-alpha reductase family enzyme
MQGFLGILIILVLGTGLAWAGSQGSGEAFGFPVFMICAVVAFGLNWLIFIHAWLRQTEHYFDLSGSTTYILLMVLAVSLSPEVGVRGWLLAGMVVVWALRLGSFLFTRIRRDGGDGRFDSIKPDFAKFLFAWTLQGLWVLLTAACALAAITGRGAAEVGLVGGVGVVLWVLGFALEVVADRQKTAFRRQSENRDQFIRSGLWSWSRHPNYVGEILLWVGVAVLALPALQGWTYLTLISPIFVYVLLSRISGVPLIEARGRRKWGEDPEYQRYLKETPVLFPGLGGSGGK